MQTTNWEGGSCQERRYGAAAAPRDEQRAAPEIFRGELDAPPALGGEHIRRRLLAFCLVIALVAAVITLAPGLGSLRSQFANARPGWLVLGGVLKVLSGLAYVLIFRAVFCRRMSWRLSTEIGLSELGANARAADRRRRRPRARRVGAQTRRHGPRRIARRSVAFFFLTSVPNVLGVIVIGLGLALGLFPGHVGLALTLGPARSSPRRRSR